ncbi:hypothetical protein H2201_008311 [Coniosporium apollinis]|uniref:SnoaL-like domain-containing protein n=2 Tax=Coniosporium TaxID=2810619 RepID=A0ABQ9NHC2_9PEZI|nr:hypothetical protein H2199_006352 [Cladosporium sp. JES 115]KAJ9657103.1 hypothetical protein H2201_008311 [Coniosporium apollinis]
MSYQTTPAFIKYCPKGWDDVRSHPAMAWMEKYTNMFDSRAAFDAPHSDWHTSDYTLHEANGTIVSGGEAGWAALKNIYSPFSAHLHDPTFLIWWETEKGWEMIGQADMCANLAAPGGQKKKDRNGNEWDVIIPSAFHFEYVKDDGAQHDGILLRRTEILADSGPAVVEMMKRGMLKPEELMK